MADFDPRLFQRAMRALARENFEFFAIRAFRELHNEPYLHNWHIAAIASTHSSVGFAVQ